MKIYGPYTNRGGRKFIIFVDGNYRKTMSYPKYLLEQKLNRELVGDETCDHIDEDFTNDDLENLQVLSRSENARKSGLTRAAEYETHVCPECGNEFNRPKRVIKRNQEKLDKKGPFCSKTCSGRYNQRQAKTFRGGKPNPKYKNPDTT